jgi:cleavage stimulation factor subunit 3
MAKLEKRMAILFPSDPQLNRFAHRFETGPPGQFDPTRVRPIISMATQARPKQIHPSIERAQHARSHSVSTQGRSTPQLPSGAGQPFSPRVAQASPRPAAASLGNLDVPHRFSPKRPFPADFDDSLRPQKVSRGESPLKGAAGRRLDAAKRRLEHHGQVTAVQPAALPRDVNFFLSILPDAKFCDSLRGRMNAGAVMAVLRAVNLGGQGAVGGVGMVRGGSGSGYGSTPGQQPMYGYPQR